MSYFPEIAQILNRNHVEPRLRQPLERIAEILEELEERIKKLEEK